MARRLSFLALLTSLLFVGQAKADSFSEILGDPPGADPVSQQIELLGTPNAAFDLWILAIESDGTNPGVVQDSDNVAGTYDADGRAVVSIGDLENPSFTLVLADDFTGSGSTDIDTDDDGVVDDVSTIVGIQDAIGVIEDAGDPVYGVQLGGEDFTANGNSSDPLIVFRDGNTGTWYTVDPDLMVYDTSGAVVAGFDLDPTVPTFGSINPSLGAGPVLRGDVNMDGMVNFLDIAPFIGILTASDFKAEADIDGNGTVNFLDIAPFIAILSS